MKLKNNKNVHLWTDEQIKELKEKYFYYLNNKKEAEEHFHRKWYSIHWKAIKLNVTSLEKNKTCGLFLGCHVSERVLSHVFKDVERMPNGNRGFDFRCNKGFKIDVKSSCLRKRDNAYTFHIKYNKMADYFLLIGFDNRIDLNPQHIWLIKSNEMIREKKLSEFNTITIFNTKYGLSQYSKYELTDKLKETIDCCNALKIINN